MQSDNDTIYIPLSITKRFNYERPLFVNIYNPFLSSLFSYEGYEQGSVILITYFREIIAPVFDRNLHHMTKLYGFRIYEWKKVITYLSKTLSIPEERFYGNDFSLEFI